MSEEVLAKKCVAIVAERLQKEGAVPDTFTAKVVDNNMCIVSPDQLADRFFLCVYYVAHDAIRVFDATVNAEFDVPVNKVEVMN